ncbi:MAG: beta-lactamase family protein [Chitinophagaceae bacterium]|nr:beta-lactamase family protein [Chitinophagaceae bacterium]
MYSFKICKAVILTFFIAVISGYQASAQKGKIKKEIKALVKQYSAAGLSVAVVKNNKLVYNRSFGYSNMEEKKKLENKNIFRIASISKSFSATAIMQLAEAGRLSLDDDFSKLVGFTVRNPAFPDDVITLRMVLSHTSSINDSQGYFTLDVINPEKNTGWAGCYSDYRPGAGYRYCNLNFNMVGTVIERIGGERFDQYILHHILQPLHLYGGYCVDSLDQSLFTTLYEYDSATQKLMAAPTAYHPRREEIRNYVQGYSTPIFSPTGGMKISAHDLAQYMMMHMNMGEYNGTRIISEQSAITMQTPLSKKENYGLALWVTDTFIPGKTLVGHTGSAYGLYSAMFFSAQEKFGLVLITNGCNVESENGWNPLLKSAAQVLYSRLIK